MDIYRDLLNTLTSNQVVQGVVVSSIGSTFIIATSEGSSQVSKQKGDVTNYKRSDIVKVKNGFLLGVLPSAKNSIRYIIR